MQYIKDIVTIAIGLGLAIIVALTFSFVISALAFGVATNIYGDFVESDSGSINIGAEVQGLEVKEPHGYEHFRVEHQRDLLLEVSNE